MTCIRKFYGTHITMTKQSGDFWKLIFTTTITYNKCYSLNRLTMPRIMSMRVRRMGPIFQQYITGFKDELRKTKVIVWGQASFKEIGLKGGAREKKRRI